MQIDELYLELSKESTSEIRAECLNTDISLWFNEKIIQSVVISSASNYKQVLG